MNIHTYINTSHTSQVSTFVLSFIQCFRILRTIMYKDTFSISNIHEHNQIHLNEHLKKNRNKCCEYS